MSTHSAPTQSAAYREGISVGLIGAIAIALWFAILDLVRGDPFATPIMLGNAVGSLFLGGELPSRAGAFLGYTVFHFAIFTLLGLAFAWTVNQAEKAPSVLIGVIGLFVAFEVGWTGFTSVLAEGFGQLTWLQVLVANLIAAAAMGFYMWRQHPSLARRVDASIGGRLEV